MHTEIITHIDLPKQQKLLALQRLTALWAFVECGLGGVLHALQVPFTGLLVGGLAIILITFIAQVSNRNYAAILKALLIVLMVKAMVSPYTPFPAYLAVSFQALLGYALFSLTGVHFFSIFLLATLAMIESAIQKLLILTLFFGGSLWKSIDLFIDFVFHQMRLSATHGSQYVIVIYLLIYFIGGMGIAWTAFQALKKIYNNHNELSLTDEGLSIKNLPYPIKKKNNSRRVLICTAALVSFALLLFTLETPKAWQTALSTLLWSLTVILIWFIIINPLVTKLIQQGLQKKKHGYQKEVTNALSFLPVAKRITVIAWQKSAAHKGWNRLQYFIILLLYWSLTYTDSPHKNVL